MATEPQLTRREATLRSAALVSLVAVALPLVVGLPARFDGGRLPGVLSLATIVACLGLGWLLAAAPPSSSAHLWRLVAGIGALVLAGWLATRAFAVPATPGLRGHWGSPGSVVTAVAAAACIALATAARRHGRTAVRGAAMAAALLVATAPGVGVALVALGPGAADAETAAGHDHGGTSTGPPILLQPGSGGSGSQYVVRVAVPPGLTAPGLALVGGAAAVFLLGAIGALHRRGTPRVAGTDALPAEGSLE